MKIAALIIDDDADSRFILGSYIRNHFPNILVAGEGATLQESVGLVQQTKPDLLLLDISLPDGTGFDLLKQVTDKSFEVIFITAHDQYAIEAFKCSAIDYLLKPVAYPDLQNALQKVAQRIQEKHFTRHWTTLAHNLGQRNPYQKKLAIASSDGYFFVEISDIVRLESHSNYTHFYFREAKKLVASHTLGYYEALLPADKFCRIHHSHLVNVDFIERYTREGAGGTVIMKDGSSLQVSQRKKENFLEQLVKKSQGK